MTGNRRMSSILLTALAMIALAAQSTAQVPTLTTLLQGFSPLNYSNGYKLNGNGVVVGAGELLPAGSNKVTAVYWPDISLAPVNLLVTVNVPSADYSVDPNHPGIGLGINNASTTVGAYGYSVIDGGLFAFGNRPFWSDGTQATDLGVLDLHTDGLAFAINDANTTVGTSGGSFGWNAVRWNALTPPTNPLDVNIDRLDDFGGTIDMPDGNDTAFAVTSDGLAAGSVVDFATGLPWATMWEAAPSTMILWAEFDEPSEVLDAIKTSQGYLLAGDLFDVATLWINPFDAALNKIVDFNPSDPPILVGDPANSNRLALPLPPGAIGSRAEGVTFDEVTRTVTVVGEAWTGDYVPHAFVWTSSDPLQSRYVDEFIHNGFSYDTAMGIQAVGSALEFTGSATNLDPNDPSPNKTRGYVAYQSPVISLALSAPSVTPPTVLTGKVTLNNVPGGTYVIKLMKDHSNVTIPTSLSVFVDPVTHTGSNRFRIIVSALGPGSAPLGHIVAQMTMTGPGTGMPPYPYMRQRAVAELGLGYWLKEVLLDPTTLRPGLSSKVIVNLTKPAPPSGLKVDLTLTQAISPLAELQNLTTGGGASGSVFIEPGNTSSEQNVFTPKPTLFALTGLGNIPNSVDDTGGIPISVTAAYGSIESRVATGVVKRWLDSVQILDASGNQVWELCSGLTYRVRVNLKAATPFDQAIALSGALPQFGAPSGLIVPAGSSSATSAPIVLGSVFSPVLPMTLSAFDPVDGNTVSTTVSLKPLVRSLVITPSVIHTGDLVTGTLTLNCSVNSADIVLGTSSANLTAGALAPVGASAVFTFPMSHINPITSTENVQVTASMLGTQLAEAMVTLTPWLGDGPMAPSSLTFTGFTVPVGRSVNFGDAASSDVFRDVTVSLSAPAAGDVLVELLASDGRVHVAALTSQTPNGTNTVSFRITGDEAINSAYGSDLTVKVTKNASVETRLIPNAVTVLPWLSSLTPASMSLPRGASGTLTVGLSGKVPSLSGTPTGTTIDVAMSSSTLAAGSVSPTTLTFNTGEQSKTVTVTVLRTTRARSFVVRAARSGIAKQSTIAVR